MHPLLPILIWHTGRQAHGLPPAPMPPDFPAHVAGYGAPPRDAVLPPQPAPNPLVALLGAFLGAGRMGAPMQGGGSVAQPYSPPASAFGPAGPPPGVLPGTGSPGMLAGVPDFKMTPQDIMRYVPRRPGGPVPMGY